MYFILLYYSFFKIRMKRKNRIVSKKEDEYEGDEKKHGAKKGDMPKLLLIPIGIAAGFIISWVYNSWQGGQVNMPLNIQKVVDVSSYTSKTNLDRYWGTYRSNLYFGLKTRSENSLNVGMMWFNQFSNNFQIRYFLIIF